MARRTKAEAEATREALLSAAEEVFFDNGVARTSLEQIARHAGLTRGAVYWHFKNKADLFRAMLDRIRMPFEELVAENGATDASPLETVRLGIQLSLLRLEQPRHRRVLAILVHRCEFFGDIDPLAMQNEMADEACGALADYFACAARLGHLRDDLSPVIAAELMQAMLGGLFHDWLRNHERFSLVAKGRELVDTQLALMRRA
ncbi:TetR family transcriptional regulator [Halomonas sp. H10-9-1]|uniref:TetR family transcriptional regulator n=1 Tax=Halomonas sp. H10-9-1 TaxID=2950871 RepID=UPI0032DFA7A4